MPMDGLPEAIVKLLGDIQQSLFDRAVKFRDEHTSRTDSYDEFKQIMEGRPGFVISPWCGSAQCEADIKSETQATIRNIPKGYDTDPGKPCIKCNGRATVSAWFAKAY
jgi:prolyl-tRNA synthetase